MDDRSIRGNSWVAVRSDGDTMSIATSQPQDESLKIQTIVAHRIPMQVEPTALGRPLKRSADILEGDDVSKRLKNAAETLLGPIRRDGLAADLPHNAEDSPRPLDLLKSLLESTMTQKEQISAEYSLISQLAQRDPEGHSLLFDAGTFKEILPLIEKLAEKKDTLDIVQRIFKIHDEKGETLWSYPEVVEAVLPWLKKLLTSETQEDYKLIYKLTTVKDRWGKTPWSYPNFATALIPLLNYLSFSVDFRLTDPKEYTLISKLLSASDGEGNTPWFYSCFVQAALPWITEFTEFAEELRNALLWDLFFKPNKDGNTPWSYPAFVDVFVSCPTKTNCDTLVAILSCKDKNNLSVLNHAPNFETVFPLFKKLVESPPTDEGSLDLLKRVFLIGYDTGETILHRKENFTKTLHLFEKLPTPLLLGYCDLLKDILTQRGAYRIHCCALIEDPENFSNALPLLERLATAATPESLDTLKTVLTYHYTPWYAAINNNENFMRAIPLLEKLATLAPPESLGVLKTVLIQAGFIEKAYRGYNHIFFNAAQSLIDTLAGSLNPSHHELLEQILAQQDERGFIALSDHIIFGNIFCLLKKLSSPLTPENGDLIKQLLSLRNEDGTTSWISHFAIVFPWLENLWASDELESRELVIFMLKLTDINGSLALHHFPNFKLAFKWLCQLQADEPSLFYDILVTRRNNGDILLHNPEHFQLVAELLKTWLVENPNHHQHVFDIFSIHDSKGQLPLQNPLIFHAAFPMLQRLAQFKTSQANKLLSTILSLRDVNVNGFPSFFAHSALDSPQNFRMALPLFAKLWLSAAPECRTWIKTIFLTPNEHNNVPLSDSISFQTAIPWLQELWESGQDESREFIQKILTTPDKYKNYPLFNHENFDQVYLWLNLDPALLFNVVADCKENGNMLLHNPWHFQRMIPMLKTLLSTPENRKYLLHIFNTQNGYGFLPLQNRNIFNAAIEMLEPLAASPQPLDHELLAAILQRKDRNGRTLLSTLDHSCVSKIVLWLSKLSAYPDSRNSFLHILKDQDKYGNTPLHCPRFLEFMKTINVWSRAVPGLWRGVFEFDADTQKSLLQMHNKSLLCPGQTVNPTWLTSPKLSVGLSNAITPEQFKEKVTQLKGWINTTWDAFEFGAEEGKIPTVYLEIKQEQKTSQEIKSSLTEMLRRIEEQVVFTATPEASDTVGRHRFYSEMLMNFESVMNQLKEKNDPKETAGTLIHIASVQLHFRCGEAYQSEISQQAMRLEGKPETLNDRIKKGAASALIAMIEQCMRDHNTSDTHWYNTFMYVAGLKSMPDQASTLSPETAKQMILNAFDTGLFMAELSTSIGDSTTDYIKSKTPADFDGHKVMIRGKRRAGPSYAAWGIKATEKECKLATQAKINIEKALKIQNTDILVTAFKELRGASLRPIISNYSTDHCIVTNVFEYGKGRIQGIDHAKGYMAIDLKSLIGDGIVPFSETAFTTLLSEMLSTTIPTREDMSANERMEVAKKRRELSGLIITIKEMVLSAKAFESKIKTLIPENPGMPEPERRKIYLKNCFQVLNIMETYKEGLAQIPNIFPKTNPSSDEGIEGGGAFELFSYNPKVHVLPSDALEEARRLDYNKEWLGDLPQELLYITQVLDKMIVK
ncbi:MAG: hypothetical protein WCF65_05670 [Parachlamydiaceae bacterium]